MKKITITQKNILKKYQKHKKYWKYRSGVKKAEKNPSYPNPNTPKTRTIQIVNPFYYFLPLQNIDFYVKYLADAQFLCWHMFRALLLVLT